MSDQPLFHFTPREVFDLFEEGIWHGLDNPARAWRSTPERLIDLLYTHTMHKRHEAGTPVHDRDELRRSIKAMFEGIE